jgi:hypothetical protein
MDGSKIFISSCSRRQLSRRRPSPNAYRLQLLLSLIVLGAAIAAFVIARTWV